jgi:hypothetical protein
MSVSVADKVLNFLLETFFGVVPDMIRMTLPIFPITLYKSSLFGTVVEWITIDLV